MKLLISLSDVDYSIPESDRAKFVSDECYRHILRGVGGVFVLFPQMRSWFKGVRFTKKLTSSFDPWDRQLVLSVYGLDRSVEHADHTLFKANKPGFNVHETRGLDSLIAHEMGHAVDHWVRSVLKTQEDSDNLLKEYQDSKRFLHATLGNPSIYARENDSEWFAERFALEHLGQKKDLLNYLKERVQK